MLALLTYFFHNLVSVFGMSVEILALNGVHVRELRFTSKQIDHQSLVVFDAFAGNLYSVYIQLIKQYMGATPNIWMSIVWQLIYPLAEI